MPFNAGLKFAWEFDVSVGASRFGGAFQFHRRTSRLYAPSIKQLDATTSFALLRVTPFNITPILWVL